MKNLKLYLLLTVLMLAGLCAPAWATFPTLSYDTVTAGTISSAAQTNTYTFSANANDILDFTVLTTKGNLLPCIQVSTYPAGEPVTNGGTCPGYGDVELNGVAVPSAGTYEVSINDFYNTNTGNYDIFLQRTNGPVGALSLPFEQVLTGNIASATQSNAYIFSANANDVFNFTLVATSGSLLPCIQVYNSAGARVTNGGSCPGYTDVELNGVKITSAGTYSVIIKDFYDTSAGNYNLFLQRTDGPPNPITLPFDSIITGKISAAAQTNNYTFAANANDILNFTLVATSGNLLPCLQVYNSAGAPVTNGGSCPGYSDVELNGVKITSAGTYTVSVKDFYDTGTGNYNLFLQRTDGPVGALSLPLGEVQTGNIGSATQSNAYIFSANANDVFNFTLVATSGGLLPCLQVYNSAGAPVTNGGSCLGYTDVELNGLKVLSAGTYSAIIKDFYDTGTGNYKLFLQRTNDPASPVNIDFDQTMTGAISAATQSNVYTFNGTANDRLNFTVVATSGNLLPCIQVYNSAGMPVQNGGTCPGYGSIQLNGFVVPEAGPYIVIIKDFYDTGLGNYSMSVQCSGTCLLPVPTLISISPTSVLAGSGAFTLSVTGTDFVNNESNSVVQWDAVDLQTTWMGLTKMTAAVPASDTACGGVIPITVFTPAPGGGTSNSIDFTVNNPMPATTLPLSPASATRGDPGFTLTVSGSNFVTCSAVLWNGNALSTTYVSATQLTAQVSASDIAAAGTASVTVFNPTPEGGTSNAQTFTINKQTPTIVWAAPAPITYGTPLGTGILDATATANGTPLTGTWVYTATISGVTQVVTSATVLPVGSYTLFATFTPADTNDYNNGSASVPLTVTPHIVTLSPTSLTFIGQEVGTASAPQSVTLTNPGDATLTIASISVTGANASSFVFANNCGTSLVGGASCTIHGHFMPASAGALTAAITITDNVSGSPQTVTLSGTGDTPPTPVLSATSLTFGLQPVGTSSATQAVTLTNTGGTALSITSITVTGADASSFIFSNTCGTSLAAGASCSIHGHFTPAASGPLTAAVAIADNATGSPQSVTLSGIGGTTISLNPSSLSFGKREIGTASASQIVTLTNTGAIPLTISSIAVTGADASSFIFANSCGTTVAAGGTCTIHGHFTPSEAATLSAAITLTDNAVGSPQSITLSGTGVNPPAVSLSVTSLSFAGQTVGTASPSQDVTLTNTGGSKLVFTSIAVTGTDASSFIFANTCGTSVAAGATCTIHGHFKPAATGGLTAAITITDNAGDSPQSIALTGTGQ